MMNNEPLYDLRDLTKEQLEIISSALEVYSRLSAGQFTTALQAVPHIAYKLITVRSPEEADKFEELVTKASNIITGRQGNFYLGIYNKELPDYARIAFHFHQAIRHQLYLDADRLGKEFFVSKAAHPAGILPDLKVNILKHE